MTSYESFFKNETDIQLMIQIAGIFDNLLKDAYTWVSEIKESLSPVKNSKERNDIVCIPKTPSQLRSKRTRAARRRKSSYLLSTAIKTSIHKRTSNKNTKVLQEHSENCQTKVAEDCNVEGTINNAKADIQSYEIAADDKFQTKRINPKARKTQSKKSSVASTIASNHTDNGNNEVHQIRKASSRLRKNLLLEFDEFQRESEAKMKAGKEGDELNWDGKVPSGLQDYNINEKHRNSKGDIRPDEMLNCQAIGKRDNEFDDEGTMEVKPSDASHKNKNIQRSETIISDHLEDAEKNECLCIETQMVSSLEPKEFNFESECQSNMDVQKGVLTTENVCKAGFSGRGGDADEIRCEGSTSNIDMNEINLSDHVEENVIHNEKLDGNQEWDEVAPNSNQGCMSVCLKEHASFIDKAVGIMNYTKEDTKMSENNSALNGDFVPAQMKLKGAKQNKKKETLQSKSRKHKTSKSIVKASSVMGQNTHLRHSSKETIATYSSDILQLKLQQEELGEKVHKLLNSDNRSPPEYLKTLLPFPYSKGLNCDPPKKQFEAQCLQGSLVDLPSKTVIDTGMNTTSNKASLDPQIVNSTLTNYEGNDLMESHSDFQTLEAETERSGIATAPIRPSVIDRVELKIIVKDDNAQKFSVGAEKDFIEHRRSKIRDENDVQTLGDHEAVQAWRDSGFASIYSHDVRQSIKSTYSDNKPFLQGDTVDLGELVSIEIEENGFPDQKILVAGSETSHHQLQESIELSGPLKTLVESVTYQPSQDQIEGTAKLIQLGKPLLSSFTTSVSSHSILSLATEMQSPVKSLLHTMAKGSPPLQIIENVGTHECLEKQESLSPKPKALHLSSHLTPTSGNMINSFKLVPVKEKYLQSLQFPKTLSNEKGKLFAPLTSSPSDLFSSVVKQTVICTASMHETKPQPLTMFSTNYTPITLSPKIEAEDGSKKFSDFLFIKDAPIKNSKSPARGNPMNFSERVFCKTVLKPVFSSNQRAPPKCILFDNSDTKSQSNLASMKSSLNPPTLFAVETIVACEESGKEKLLTKERCASIGESNKCLNFEEQSDHREVMEECKNINKESPAKSLFSNIKDSCKKMWSFKKSPSPSSKTDVESKKSFWPISPNTPIKNVHESGKVVSESDLEKSSPIVREKKFLPNLVIYDSPDVKNLKCTPDARSPFVPKKKCLTKSSKMSDDHLGSLKKSRKPITLKVGIPWKKNKRKSSSITGRNLSSDIKKLSGYSKTLTSNLDKEFEDIISKNGVINDSMDSLEKIYNNNLSVLPQKNLNATYLVPLNEKKAGHPEVASVQGTAPETHVSNLKMDDSSETGPTASVCDVTKPVGNPVDKCTVTPRRSGVKRRSSTAGLREEQAAALKYMRVSDQFKTGQPIIEACEIDLVKTDTKMTNPWILLAPIDLELMKDQQVKPASDNNLKVMEVQDTLRIAQDVQSSVKTISRTATIKDKFKHFFQVGSVHKKTTMTSTPSTCSLPQRVATQFPISSHSNSNSQLSRTKTSAKKPFSSLFKNKTTTKVPKWTGCESETSESSNTCSTDSKSLTSKKMISSKYPSNYFSVKTRNPLTTAASSSEDLHKQKVVDKKQRFDEADKRKAEEKHRKAEEARRKREEKLLLVEQRRKEQEEKKFAAMAQKMEEKAKMTEKILMEKEKEEREKHRLREKRMIEAEQRRKQEEESRAHAQLQLDREREKQEEAVRRQKGLEVQEKLMKMAEIRRLEEMKRMEVEKERKLLQEKARQAFEQDKLKAEKVAKDKIKTDTFKMPQSLISKTELQKRLEEERNKREIEKKIQEHNKKMAAGHFKKGLSANELNRKMLRGYNPDNYDISKIKFEDGTDDEDNPRKQIPRWATEPYLSEEIHRQHLHPPNLDAIFDLQFSINLAEAFTGMKPRYFKRTSSAHWDAAPVTHNVSMYRP